MLTTVATGRASAGAYLAWILAAAGVGFLVSAVFAGWLRWPRSQYLVPLLLIEGALIALYVRWSAIDVRAALAHRWPLGVAVGLVAGLLLVRNVLSQPGSATPEGPRLLGHLLWEGLAYGGMDALLLTVVPIHAAWQMAGALDWLATWPGRIGAALVALLASGLVTALYHAGYPEFRNADLVLTVVGNTIVSLAYLLAGTPVAPVVAHAMMHVAAVWHGAETTLQLPPHY